jgi:hypothetical protein
MSFKITKQTNLPDSEYEIEGEILADVVKTFRENTNDWQTELNKHTFEPAFELHTSNFEELKEKWIINKIHRTMIINANGTIKNAFVSLFDVNFEDHLKD